MTITAVSLDALASNRPAGRAPAEGPMALAGASFAAMLHARGPQRPAPHGTAADAQQDTPPSPPSAEAGREPPPADATGRQACHHPHQGASVEQHDLGARGLEPGSICGDAVSATPSPALAAAQAEADGDLPGSEAGVPPAPDAAAPTIALPRVSTTAASDLGAAQVMPSRSGRVDGARAAGPDRQAQRQIRSRAPTQAERVRSPAPQAARAPAGPTQVAAQSATAGATERELGPSHATQPDSASPAVAGLAIAIPPTVVPAAALPLAMPASDRGRAETDARAASRVSPAGSARTPVPAVSQEARTRTPLSAFAPPATGRPEAGDAITVVAPASADHAPALSETLVPIDMRSAQTASALPPHAAPGAVPAATPIDPGPAAAPVGAPITAPVAVAAAPPQPGPSPLREAHIAAALGDPGFAPAIGTTLAVMARDGVQHARLQLHPAEMGPITVQIAVDGASARIDFHAAVAETRQALESALPTLAGALRETGLTLTGGGVHQQAPGQHGRDPDRPTPGSPGHGRAHTDEAIAAPLLVRARRGLVDLVA